MGGTWGGERGGGKTCAVWLLHQCPTVASMFHHSPSMDNFILKLAASLCGKECMKESSTCISCQTEIRRAVFSMHTWMGYFFLL